MKIFKKAARRVGTCYAKVISLHVPEKYEECLFAEGMAKANPVRDTIRRRHASSDTLILLNSRARWLPWTDFEASCYRRHNCHCGTNYLPFALLNHLRRLDGQAEWPITESNLQGKVSSVLGSHLANARFRTSVSLQIAHGEYVRAGKYGTREIYDSICLQDGRLAKVLSFFELQNSPGHPGTQHLAMVSFFDKCTRHVGASEYRKRMVSTLEQCGYEFYKILPFSSRYGVIRIESIAGRANVECVHSAKRNTPQYDFRADAKLYAVNPHL